MRNASAGSTCVGRRVVVCQLLSALHAEGELMSAARSNYRRSAHRRRLQTSGLQLRFRFNLVDKHVHEESRTVANSDSEIVWREDFGAPR